jgi:hypothetical protein
MSRGRKYGLLVVVLLMTVLLVWMFSDPPGTLTKNATKQYVSSNWDKKYDWESKDAYGLHLMQEIIIKRNKSVNPERIESESMLDSSALINEKRTYVFIGADFGLYNKEIDTLFDRVFRGSELFISASDVSVNFAESFNPALLFSFDFTSSVRVKFDTNNYNFTYRYQNDTIAYPWKIIKRNGSFENSTKILSRLSGLPNFIRFPHGKGSIMIHSTPELFYNYNLATKDGFFHAEKVAHEFKAGNKIAYLELARLDEDKEEDIFEMMRDNEEGERDDSYLQFLLQTPSLRAAMLLTLFGFLLFMLFRTKRTQPIVEVKPVKRNVSAVFVQTIASIYRNRDNPFSVLLLIRKNFYNTIQKHYFIDLSKRSDLQEIRHLSGRSNIPVEEIEELLQKLESANVAKINEEYLIEVTNLKRSFYERAGIISDRILQRLEQKEQVFYRTIWMSFPIIFVGIALVFAGLYLLVAANGTGILLWPLGTIALIWGILRMTKPLLKLRATEFVYFPLVGAKRIFPHDTIVSCRHHERYLELHYSDGRDLIIPFTELSSADRKQLELFLIRKQILEL